MTPSMIAGLAPAAALSTPSLGAPLGGSSAAPASTAPPGDAGEDSFAHCLGQARAQDGASAPVARDDPAAEEAAPKASARAGAKAGARTGPSAPGPHVKGAIAAGPGARTAIDKASAPMAPADAISASAPAQADAPEKSADKGGAAAPDLSSLLPGWNAGPAPAPAAGAAPAGIAVGGEALDGDPAGKEHARNLPGAAIDPASRLPVVALPAQGLAAPAGAAADMPAAQAPSAARAKDGAPVAFEARAAQGPASTARDPSFDAPGALLAGLPAGLQASTATAAPHGSVNAAAHVAAALDSPGFAPALATQVRWLVQDGVQQARITLNPAEMGPVAVQIVIDGRDARIDFSADLPATRQALEASLPTLAAALDDSGLKLAGGGVHDGQAQRRQEAWAGASPGPWPGAAAARADEAGPARPRAAAGRGLVDLVA
jgi:flagellar hook-length control protein FliK